MNLTAPTSTRDVRLVARTARLVLSIPAYLALAALTAAAALSVFVFSQNVGIVTSVGLNPAIPLDGRVTVLLQQYPFLGPAYRPLTEVLLVSAAALFGVDVAMLAYHLRRDRVSVREGSGSAAGVVLGTLGAGCATCGTALLAGVLSLFGATGILTALPLDGAEFAVLAVGTLALSIYWLADGMRGGEINGCPVDLDGTATVADSAD